MNLGPHELLEGVELANGWRVTARLPQTATATGVYFSCGYLVEHIDGHHGFLKALDFFSGLKHSTDLARDLQPLLDAFNFERDLLDKCKQRRLSRVVTALDHGAVKVPGLEPPLCNVQYIIFELAEGDVRGYLETSEELTAEWALRVLHHAAVGLNQLHAIHVAHQDIKPSNILQFEGRMLSKLADLGRAAERDRQPPHYQALFAGDRGYAPPELLYRAGPGLTWDERRLGCDLYHLGSLICSLFTTVGMTPLLALELHPSLHWDSWRGTYDDALLFLRPAFGNAVEYVELEIPESYRHELGTALRQLCDPDPRRRGHPRDRAIRGSNFRLHRYISLFAKLLAHASWKISVAKDVGSH